MEKDISPETKFRKLKIKDKIGLHIPFEKTIQNTIDFNLEVLKPLKPSAFQFFLSAKGYKIPVVKNDEYEEIKNIVKRNNINCYIHSPLIINLANLKERGFYCMKNLIEISNGINFPLVVHIGSVNGIDQIVETINSFNISGKRKNFLLENSAGQGTSIGKTWDEIEEIFRRLDNDSIGLCIDTQHIFASGMCNMKNKECIDDMFKRVDNLGKNILKLVHLNDSKTKYGSCVDRHECISSGEIWKESLESFDYLVDKCNKRRIDMILETPNIVEDYINICKYRR